MTDTTTANAALQPTSFTVGDGDDQITVDVRGNLADATPERPALVTFGSPMDASGFGSLAARFTDRPVVTFDPRGSGRNPIPTSAVTPKQHAEDLHPHLDAKVVTAERPGRRVGRFRDHFLEGRGKAVTATGTAAAARPGRR